MVDTPRRNPRSPGSTRIGAGVRAARALGPSRTSRGETGRPAGTRPGTVSPTTGRSGRRPARVAPDRGGQSPAPGDADVLGGGADRGDGVAGPGGAGRAGSSPISGSRRSGRVVPEPANGRGSADGSGRADRSRSRLALQVAVLGLVFCAVALVLAVPLRSYLAQRAQLDAAVTAEHKLTADLAAARQQQAALSDPAYVRSEAKRRLQYVLPGDTVYVVHAPPLPPSRPAGGATPAPTSPWFAQLWNTLSDPKAAAAGPASSKPSGVARASAPAGRIGG